MKFNFLVISIVLVLSVGLVSAFWPFSAEITGNVVNTEYINSLVCQDGDNGTFSDVASAVIYKDVWGNSKEKSDICSPSGKSVVEYYCSPKNGKIVSTTILCAGGCDAGACKADFCVDLGSKRFKDKTGTFKTGCEDNSFVTYACNVNGTAVVKADTQACVGSCTPSGCRGNCTTLGEGNILMDNKPLKNSCGAGDYRGSVLQYSCNGTALVKDRVSCGRGRECVADANGIGSCRDIIAGTETVGDLNQQVADLQTEVSGISAKINQAFNSCSPVGALSSDQTGNQACAAVNKTCMIGLNYGRIMNATSGVISPLHLIVRSCSQDQNIMTDPFPEGSGLSVDMDPSWICCSA